MTVPLRIGITTDGTAGRSIVVLERGREVEEIPAHLIKRASCSVHTYPRSGHRVITAIVWVAPAPSSSGGAS